MDTNYRERTLPTAILGLLPARATRWLNSLLLALSIGRYRCTVCGRRVAVFRPYAIPRAVRRDFPYMRPGDFETFSLRHYECPSCGAIDRARLMALYLRRRLPRLPKGARMLDIAPAAPLSAFIRREIAKTGRAIEYLTADLYDPNVDDCVDVTDMAVYGDGQFDLLLCSHVLEHVTDDRRALSELFRVLRRGGTAVILVPIPNRVVKMDEDPAVTDGRERIRRFGQADHVRLYSREGFLSRVERVGFQASRYGVQEAGEDEFRANGLEEDSVLYLCRKE